MSKYVKISVLKLEMVNDKKTYKREFGIRIA